MRPGRAAHAKHPVVVASRDERGGDLSVAVDHYIHAAERCAREQVVQGAVVRHELLEHRVRERRPHILAVGESLLRSPYPLEFVTMSLRPAYLNRTSVSGSLTGNFVSSRPLIALKSAVLAPIPSASDTTTTAVQPLA